MDLVKAGDLMSSEVVAVGPLEPVSSVIRLFIEKRISAIPVVGKERKVIGIITKADVIAHTLSWGAPVISASQASAEPPPHSDESERAGALVRDVMNPMFIAVSPETSPIEVARIMREHNIHNVPITVEGKLVGMVSSFDLLRLLPRSP